MHQNYVGIDTDKNPYFLSIVSHESGNKSTPLYRAMLFRKQVCSIFLIFFLYFISMEFHHYLVVNNYFDTIMYVKWFSSNAKLWRIQLLVLIISTILYLVEHSCLSFHKTLKCKHSLLFTNCHINFN